MTARTLLEHPEPISVVKLAAGSDLPVWADGLPITSVTWTSRETSVVCPSRCIPDALPGTIEGPFTAFEVAGDLPLTLTGILSSLTEPLAQAQVSAFAISTYATDWLLVKAQSTQAAKASWALAGFDVVEATMPRDIVGPTLGAGHNAAPPQPNSIAGEADPT